MVGSEVAMLGAGCYNVSQPCPFVGQLGGLLLPRNLPFLVFFWGLCLPPRHRGGCFPVSGLSFYPRQGWSGVGRCFFLLVGVWVYGATSRMVTKTLTCSRNKCPLSKRHRLDLHWAISSHAATTPPSPAAMYLLASLGKAIPFLAVAAKQGGGNQVLPHPTAIQG